MEISDEQTRHGESNPKEQLLRESQASIRNNRITQLAVTGLQPNTPYEVTLQMHDFPFGAAIDGSTIVQQNNMDRLTRLSIDADYAERYKEVFAEYFNGGVEENWYKWERMHDDPRAPQINAALWKYFTDHPEILSHSRGHNVVWNRRTKLPEYLRDKSKEEILDVILNERLDVIKNYPFPEWDVINEPLGRGPTPYYVEGVNQHEVIFDPKTDIDSMAQIYKRAKEINPNTKLYINEISGAALGEHFINYETNEELEKITDTYYDLIKGLLDRGAPLDGIGLQMHFRPGREADLQEIVNNIKQLATLGLPIKITELSMPDEDFGGESNRAEALQELLTVLYGIPEVQGIYFWGFDTKLHYQSREGLHAGLFDEQMQPNAVGKAFSDTIHSEWSTHTPLQTDEQGRVTFHGFPGTYAVINQQDSSSTTAVLRAN